MNYLNAKILAEYCATPEPVEPPAELPESPCLGILDPNGEGNLFYSIMPESPDACVSIFDTGGWAKDEIFPRADLTFQFLFRAPDYDAAQVLIKKLSDFFLPSGIPKQNFYIGSFYVHMVTPNQPAAFQLGYDLNGRIKFSWNFTFIIH
jgi:hypothetical protein